MIQMPLCPALDYKHQCCVAGNCVDCPNYFTNEGEDCKGCKQKLKQ